jgi:hypothetical protein
LPNGTLYTTSHNWSYPEIYTIRVYAKDENNANSKTMELTVLIDTHYTGSIGYLIDSDSDGVYDLFHSNATRKETVVELQADGKYLIDNNGDEIWDYTYEPTIGLLLLISMEEEEVEETEIPWTMTVAIIIILAIIAIIVFLYKKGLFLKS